MTTELKISAHETLHVLSSTPEVFDVEATYEPHGARPPAHFHPAQDEHFEVLEGRLRVELDGQPRSLESGQQLAINRRHVHRMWNDGDVTARVRWTTMPALRTESWFTGLAALQAAAAERGSARPDLLAFGAHADRHRDTFRLVVGGPRPLGGIVVRVLATAARLTGRAKPTW